VVCGSNGLHGVLPWLRPIYHDIGQADFFRQRHLTSYSSDGVGAGEAIASFQSGDLGFAVGCDDDRPVDSVVDSGFEQERHVVDNDGVRVFSCCLFGESRLFACDTGVDDAFKPTPLGLVSENNGSQLPAIEGAVGIQYGLPECVDDLSPSLFAGLDDLMGQFVGIDHDRAALLEHLGNCAFPGRDAACEANENHGGGA
jgi:hypothetical protein